MQPSIEQLRTLARTIVELDALVTRLSSQLDDAGDRFRPELKAEVARLHTTVRTLHLDPLIRDFDQDGSRPTNGHQRRA